MGGVCCLVFFNPSYPRTAVRGSVKAPTSPRSVPEGTASTPLNPECNLSTPCSYSPCSCAVTYLSTQKPNHNRGNQKTMSGNFKHILK